MLELFDKALSSNFILGTSQYPSLECMIASIEAAQVEMVTVSLKRSIHPTFHKNNFWEALKKTKCHILPNTAGCKTAAEAIQMAEMAREIFETDFIKVEVIGDDYNLQPNVIELVKACEQLILRGFKVLPYTTEDLSVATYLVELGCEVLMPWGAPIGSGKGVINPYALNVLRERFPQIKLIVDAGLGVPSDAAQVMEMGCDGVLLNSAVAQAGDPVKMAKAFSQAIDAGKKAYEAQRMPERSLSSPSTNLLETPFWQV
ncbi:thiazole synthase [Francisella adeliensis]|uniref:Thiazole synthase n=1 Tax=Francisella adeliensis TaxID=2007306 RepID=A0A2Z4Y154_9GAMM|nr:thiazole synthase [Francisella adeliensis]AXA34462.1 thiazole synthase [Francisella adeliensis]MBK2086543.1 thiazole synthase [Francisella adeliensis]MBK2096398.1 thiazole synthase [Francisella adeliensis]QIW12709.1 thiazole synthase [Francisella adeliensis]QIW14585.1 thiazole synthase [Francisella adeliensis]